MPSKFKRLAAIDVGSNSLHLVIAKVSPDGKFSVLDKMKAPVRLGEGGGKFLHLSDDAISEGVKALKALQRLLKKIMLMQLEQLQQVLFEKQKTKMYLSKSF